MSASYVLLLGEAPVYERVAAAAATLDLRPTRDDRWSFRAEGSSRAVHVEVAQDDDGSHVVALRTASGRSRLDAWLQGQLALALVEKLGARLAPGERVTLEDLRALPAPGEGGGAVGDTANGTLEGAAARGTWARRNLRPLATLAAMLLATAGAAVLIVRGEVVARPALILFVGAALAALLAFAERRR